jgi:hypothetical protein
MTERLEAKVSLASDFATSPTSHRAGASFGDVRPPDSVRETRISPDSKFFMNLKKRKAWG